MEESSVSVPELANSDANENKLLMFIHPYLAYIDRGEFFRKPFNWLYVLLAVVNILLPLVILYELISNQIFDAPFKIAFTVLLAWAVIAVAGWISFQIWWNRRNKITTTSYENAEFVATPAFSHFIQTLGGWIGTWLGFVGSITALFASVLLKGSERSAITQIPIVGEYLEGGFAYVSLCRLSASSSLW